jgi:hypothetical protein
MSDAAADAAPKSEQEILSTYRRMQSEMQGLIQHLTKIEMERNEHRYVVYECIVFFFRNDAHCRALPRDIREDYRYRWY